MCHEWGSTHNNYEEMNMIKIPKHHTLPEKSIDITIPNDENLIKEVMKNLKHLDGHFILNIRCEKDISRYLKSMRNVKLVGVYSEVSAVLDGMIQKVC